MMVLALSLPSLFASGGVGGSEGGIFSFRRRKCLCPGQAPKPATLRPHHFKSTHYLNNGSTGKRLGQPVHEIGQDITERQSLQIEADPVSPRLPCQTVPSTPASPALATLHSASRPCPMSNGVPKHAEKGAFVGAKHDGGNASLQCISLRVMHCGLSGF